jgi:hypothetical protein
MKKYLSGITLYVIALLMLVGCSTNPSEPLIRDITEQETSDLNSAAIVEADEEDSSLIPDWVINGVLYGIIGAMIGMSANKATKRKNNATDKDSQKDSTSKEVK